MAIAISGCNTPSRSELLQENAAQFATPHSIEGDYEDAASGSPSVSLWFILTHERIERGPDLRSVKLINAGERLTAQLHDGKVVVASRETPFRYAQNYFRGNFSHAESGTQCTFPAYVAEDVAIGTQADGSLVVISKTQFTALFLPFPGYSSGAAEPWTNVFHRVAPTSQPAQSNN